MGLRISSLRTVHEMLLPAKKPAQAGTNFLDEKYGLHRRVRAAPDVAADLINVLLRSGRISWREIEQSLDQINQSEKQNQKDQACNHDGGENPHRRDCRPTAYVTASMKGGYAHQHDQYNDEKGS